MSLSHPARSVERKVVEYLQTCHKALIAGLTRQELDDLVTVIIQRALEGTANPRKASVAEELRQAAFAIENAQMMVDRL